MINRQNFLITLFGFLIFSSHQLYADVANDSQSILACDLSQEEVNFLLKQVQDDNKTAISTLSECKKANRQLFAQIIDTDPSYFEFAASNLRDDEVFISKFVAQNPEILEYISDRLKSDQYFMSKMMRNYPDALKYSSPKLADNKGFMMKTIAINPRNFSYASDRLQDDEEVALLAVKTSGKMLKFASDRLQNNEKVVRQAIESYSLALNFASERLQKDRQMQKLSAKNNYNFLKNFDTFLKENYGGLPVGPEGSRGYSIVNMAKLFPDKQIVYRPYLTKWERVYKNGVETDQLRLVAQNPDHSGWKDDFRDYPQLISEIENIFLINNVDQNTIDSLNTISLWQISDHPRVLVFDLYLLRSIDNKYLKAGFANVTSLTAVAREKVVEKRSKKRVKKKGEAKNRQWEISVIDDVFDSDLAMDLSYKNGHKRYKIWDVYQASDHDKNSKVLFKVEDKNSEYFELFAKQLNDRYATIYRGGGYAIDIIPY